MLTRKQCGVLLALEDFHGNRPCELFRQIDTMAFAIAVRTTELLDGPEGKKKRHYPVVGALWGDIVCTRSSMEPSGYAQSLEIKEVVIDPAYEVAAEEWMLDQLKNEMMKRDWRHLMIRSVADNPDDPYTEFADRHQFVVRDVRRGKFIWQWPADDEGIRGILSSE
jgi:hypothetical protein